MTDDQKQTQSLELLTYQVRELQTDLREMRIEAKADIAELRGQVKALSDALVGQKAARGALLGAAGILGGVVAFLGDVLFRLFHR